MATDTTASLSAATTAYSKAKSSGESDYKAGLAAYVALLQVGLQSNFQELETNTSASDVAQTVKRWTDAKASGQSDAMAFRSATKNIQPASAINGAIYKNAISIWNQDLAKKKSANVAKIDFLKSLEDQTVSIESIKGTTPAWIKEIKTLATYRSPSSSKP